MANWNKLTIDEIEIIKMLLGKGVTIKDCAKITGRGIETINRVKRGSYTDDGQYIGNVSKRKQEIDEKKEDGDNQDQDTLKNIENLLTKLLYEQSLTNLLLRTIGKR